MMTSPLPLGPIIVLNSPESSTSPKHTFHHHDHYYSCSKIPFENSRIMDECRVEVLRKFRKDVVNTVRFGDVSRVLIACGLVSKEECFEICKLPMSKQMAQCYQKVHDIMDILVCQKATANEKNAGRIDGGSNNERRIGSERRVEETDKQNGLVKDIWKNFVTALRAEHTQLATKMENELDKSAESRLLLKKGSGSTRSLVRKEDIGCPKDFQHVQHFGLTCDKRRVGLSESKREQGDGAVASPVTLPPGSINEVNYAITNDQTSAPTIDLDENDADLKEFFKRAGVVSRQLVNPVTRRIIWRFIEENGGMDAIREEVRRDHFPEETTTRNSEKAVSNKETGAGGEQYQSISSTDATNCQLNAGCEGQEGSESVTRIACGRSCSDTELVKRDDGQRATGTPPPAPATVPFQPTPRPTSNLYYF